MHHAHLSRVIRVAVMAFGEDGHRIDMAHAHRLREALGIEIRTNILDKGRGVKIEMNLSITQLDFLSDGSHEKAFLMTNDYSTSAHAAF
jgi:hypothetical protein